MRDGQVNATDEELVARARTGDSAPFGILIGRYHSRLYGMVLRILRNEADAEDAVQDACLLGFTRLEQFAGRSSFFTWMARIAMNEAFSRVRRHRRREILHSEAGSPANLQFAFAGAPTPEQQAIDREMYGVLRSSVRALPESYREVLAMHEFEEVGTVEAAASLGLTVECVKTRLHRARELLRRKFHTRTRARCAA